MRVGTDSTLRDRLVQGPMSVTGYHQNSHTTICVVFPQQDWSLAKQTMATTGADTQPTRCVTRSSRAKQTDVTGLATIPHHRLVLYEVEVECHRKQTTRILRIAKYEWGAVMASQEESDCIASHVNELAPELPLGASLCERWPRAPKRVEEAGKEAVRQELAK